MAKAKVSEDKIVRDVIKKYGETIDLKATPFVLIEILRSYGRFFDPSDGGLPPGGAPEPPGPSGREIDNSLLLQEILKLGREIKALQQQLARG